MSKQPRDYDAACADMVRVALLVTENHAHLSAARLAYQVMLYAYGASRLASEKRRALWFTSKASIELAWSLAPNSNDLYELRKLALNQPMPPL